MNKTVSISREEILNLLENLVMSYIKKAHSVGEASIETANTLRKPLQERRQNSYEKLVFIPEPHTHSFDPEFLNELVIVQWDPKATCWLDKNKFPIYFSGKGKFMERISELETWNIIYKSYNNLPNLDWELNSKLLHEDLVSSALRPAQKLAARKIISNYSFIWGPPGTGKTFTSASIIDNLIEQDCKVLITSTANRAVDEIMDQLITFNATCDNKIARYGGDRIEVGERFEIPRLQKKLLTSDDPNSEYAQIDRIMSKVTAVFANTAAVQCNQRFASMSFQYVLFDETSMIPAYVVEAFRCLYPGAKFIFAGDPMQLPPVIEDSQLAAQKYARNVYDYPEIQHQFKLFLSGQNSVISFLDLQSRMHSELGSAVSKAFYYGKLESSKSPASELALPDYKMDYEKSIFASGELTILGHKALEVSDLPEEKVNKNANLLEATWIVDKVSSIKKKHEDYQILVITPFVNQVTLIKKLLKRNDVNVATVHKAQGSQADVVLFSLAGSEWSNWFVYKCAAHLSEKLINVAISRTKVQCIVIGSERHLVNLSPLTKLQRAYIGGPVEVAASIEPPQVQVPQVQAAKVRVEPVKAQQLVQHKEVVSEVDQMRLRIEALEAENLRLTKEIERLKEKAKIKGSNYSLEELSSKPFFVKGEEEF